MTTTLNVKALQQNFLLVLALFGGTYDSGVLFRYLLENAPFLFVLVCCFLGVLRGMISAKAKGNDITFVEGYSAFFSYVLLSIGMGFSYYVQHWDVLWLAFGGMLIGAVINGIVSKLIEQLDQPADFMGLLDLIRRIALAVWETIRAGKGNNDNQLNDKR